MHSPFRAHVTDPLRGCQFPIVLGASPAFLWLMRGNARGLAPTSSEMLGLLVTSSLAPPGTPGGCQWILVPAILLDAKMESIALTRPMSLGLTLTHPEGSTFPSRAGAQLAPQSNPAFHSQSYSHPQRSSHTLIAILLSDLLFREAFRNGTVRCCFCCKCGNKATSRKISMTKKQCVLDGGSPYPYLLHRPLREHNGQKSNHLRELIFDLWVS